jgi:hypothetical protein
LRIPVLAPVLALLLAPLRAACGSDAVRIDNFRVSAAGHQACPALLGSLPTRVADQPRRRPSGSTFGAAWGKNAIVLRCGVSGKPKGYTRFAACQRADGVDWFVPESVMADQGADVVMTTVGRSPAVQVTVPASYRPATAPMVDLAEVVKAHTREVSPCS